MMMNTVYGDTYEPLYARIEQGNSNRLIAKIDLPNGNEQICFIADATGLRSGQENEVMIAGVVHPMHKGRRDRRRVIALMVQPITDEHQLMGISGFVKANERDKPQSLALESYGDVMTQATANRVLDMHSCRPMSMGHAIRSTRVVTPGTTGAAYVSGGSRKYRDGSLNLLGATNVWVRKEDIQRKGRAPVPIAGLTRPEDLDVFHMLEGRPRMKKAA